MLVGCGQTKPAFGQVGVLRIRWFEFRVDQTDTICCPGECFILIVSLQVPIHSLKQHILVFCFKCFFYQVAGMVHLGKTIPLCCCQTVPLGRFLCVFFDPEPGCIAITKVRLCFGVICFGSNLVKRYGFRRILFHSMGAKMVRATEIVAGPALILFLLPVFQTCFIDGRWRLSPLRFVRMEVIGVRENKQQKPSG